MKNCKDHCKKYDTCTDVSKCYYMTAELNRIERPRRKHRVELMFEAGMERAETIAFANNVYAAFDDTND